MDAAANNLPANQTFKNQNQLYEKQKAEALKCITIHKKKSITVKKMFQSEIITKKITSCR